MDCSLERRLAEAPAPHGSALLAATTNTQLRVSARTSLRKVHKNAYRDFRRALEEAAAGRSLDAMVVTKILQEYKDSLDLVVYDSPDLPRVIGQTKVLSSVLEEFFSVLLTRISWDHDPELGAGPTPGITGFRLDDEGNLVTDTKNVDAAVYRPLPHLQGSATQILTGIECKTNLDKTMLDSISKTAEDLKKVNAATTYIVVTEWLDMPAKRPASAREIDDIITLRHSRPSRANRLTALSNAERARRRDEYIAFLKANPFHVKTVAWVLERSRRDISQPPEARFAHSF